MGSGGWRMLSPKAPLGSGSDRANLHSPKPTKLQGIAAVTYGWSVTCARVCSLVLVSFRVYVESKGMDHWNVVCLFPEGCVVVPQRLRVSSLSPVLPGLVPHAVEWLLERSAWKPTQALRGESCLSASHHKKACVKRHMACLQTGPCSSGVMFASPLKVNACAQKPRHLKRTPDHCSQMNVLLDPPPPNTGLAICCQTQRKQKFVLTTVSYSL